MGCKIYKVLSIPQNIHTSYTAHTFWCSIVPHLLFLKVGRIWASPLTSIWYEVNTRWSYTATALVRTHGTYEVKNFTLWTMHMTFRIFFFDYNHNFLLSSSQRKTFCHNDIMTWQNKNYYSRRTDLYRNRQFSITMKHAKRSTDIKRTPGSVNGDVFGSWYSPSLTAVIRSTKTSSTFFPTTEDVAHKALWEPSSLLRESMQFCKSTTVMTVVLTHYMKLSAIKTKSCSVKVDNSCSLQINCIANYKITNTK